MSQVCFDLVTCHKVSDEKLKHSLVALNINVTDINNTVFLFCNRSHKGCKDLKDLGGLSHISCDKK